MPNKKICHITTVHSSFDVRIFHKECKTLVKVGYDVTLVAQHDKDEVVNGVKIVALPTPKNRLHRMCILPLKVFSLALKQKADLYHFHDPELMPVGILLKLFTGKRIIYDVHEDYAKQILSKPYIPKIARRDIAFLINLMEGISSRFFDAIVTATDDILKNFSYHKKAISVKNFPIVADFSDIKRNTNDNKGFFNLIYVGGLTEIRGITQMIQALEFINSQKVVKLILCGKFYPQSYEKQIKSRKGFENVEHLGWIRPQEVPEKTTQSDVGIICFLPEPNHINAMPNKLFEYMACGLPVIASNFTLWKEIVEENNCGICVNPLNPKEITKAIEYLIEHPDERRKMGENGRKAVLEKYNWEEESLKLLTLYRQLC
ncbi:MAG: glycosyltransferase family 4 protein [Candidatus Stahlbacteria bacterium]|nr:glycosyltransferase family 4 protein [Candidatus Stahlbacteria bacterium]